MRILTRLSRVTPRRLNVRPGLSWSANRRFPRPRRATRRSPCDPIADSPTAHPPPQRASTAPSARSSALAGRAVERRRARLRLASASSPSRPPTAHLPPARCAPTQLNRSAVLPGTSLAVSPAAGLLRRLRAHPDQPARGAASALSEVAHERLDQRLARRASCSPTRRETARASCPSTPFRPGETVTVRGTRAARGRQHAALRATRSWSPTQDTLTYEPRAPSARQDHRRGAALPLRSRAAAAGARRRPTARRGPRPGTSSPPPTAAPARAGRDLQRSRRTSCGSTRSPGEDAATNLQVQQLRRPAGADLVAGLHPPAGIRRGRRDDRQQLLPADRPGARGQRLQGRPARLPHHPDGTALLTVFDPIDCNLSARSAARAAARSPTASSRKSTWQTGLVRREWHSLDHVPLSDSYSSPEGSARNGRSTTSTSTRSTSSRTAATLICARNTWTLYELNTITGQVGSRASAASAAASSSPPARPPPSSTTRPCTPNGDDQRVRQRRRAEGPSAVARASSCRSNPQTPAPTRCSPATSTPPRSPPTARETCRRCRTATCSSAGARSPTSRNSARAAAAVRRPPARLLPVLPHLPLPLDRHAGRSRPRSRRALRGRKRPSPFTRAGTAPREVASWRVLAGPSAHTAHAGGERPKSGFETAIATPGPARLRRRAGARRAGAVLGTSPHDQGLKPQALRRCPIADRSDGISDRPARLTNRAYVVAP